MWPNLDPNCLLRLSADNKSYHWQVKNYSEVERRCTGLSELILLLYVINTKLPSAGSYSDLFSGEKIFKQRSLELDGL